MLTRSASNFNTSDHQRRPMVFVLAVMALFWTLFDATMSYMSPILIADHDFSTTVLGLIIASSSFAGAIFDFAVCRIFSNTNFRRLFLIMFAVCAVYPFLLWEASSVWFFIFVMALWGIYYDMIGFGVFSFIGRYTKKEEFTNNFGIVQVFRAIACVLAPIIVGLIVTRTDNRWAMYFGLIVLVVSFLFFIVLNFLAKKHGPIIADEHTHRKRNILVEIHLWRKLTKFMLPVLLITFFIFLVESFFWTLGPLYAENSELGKLGGLFLTMYTLPAVIIGWFVGSIAKKFGKKRTAAYSLFIGSLFLTSFAFWNNIFILMSITFVASLFIGASLPAVNGVYTDFISEKPIAESEIEGLEDFSFNLGYIIGPILAGLLSDIFSISTAFTVLGMIGVALTLVLIKIMPRQINIAITRNDVKL